MSRAKRTTFYPLAIIIILSLLIGGLEYKTGIGRFFGYVGYIEVKERLQRRRFDSATWKSTPSMRIRMVDDLIKRRTLIGLDKKQVIHLLGKPDSSVGDLIYDLGPERGWISIDTEMLEIHLDPRGKVSNADLSVS